MSTGGDSFTFTKPSVQRIEAAVKWVERRKRTSPTGSDRSGDLVPFNFRRFELKEALPPGGTAEAYLLQWSAYDNDYTINEDVTFDVSDAFGEYRGRGKDALSSPNDQGSRGWAIKATDGDRWEIIKMQPHALKISCLASAANTGTSPISVDTVAVMQPTGGLLMAVITSVVNRHLWKCNDNANIEADWNEAAAAWWAYQVDCQ